MDEPAYDDRARMARMRIYVQSAVSGMLALLVFVILIAAIAIGALFIASDAGGFDLPVVHLHDSSVAVLILVFLAVFYWKFRRLSKAQPRSGATR